MGITEETRREAYYEAQESAPTRRKEIYRRLLKGGPMRADSLMAAMGYINPNSVRPRLTELLNDGLVRAIGKAKNREGRKVTLWEAVEVTDKGKAALDAANIEGGGSPEAG